MTLFVIGWAAGGFVMWAWWEWTIHQASSDKPDAKINPMAFSIRRRMLESFMRNVGNLWEDRKD